jgi:hypothetical protein
MLHVFVAQRDHGLVEISVPLCAQQGIDEQALAVMHAPYDACLRCGQPPPPATGVAHYVRAHIAAAPRPRDHVLVFALFCADNSACKAVAMLRIKDTHAALAATDAYRVRCTYCKQVGGAVFSCTRCTTVYYCSDACQWAHWPEHETACYYTFV